MLYVMCQLIMVVHGKTIMFQEPIYLSIITLKQLQLKIK